MVDGSCSSVNKETTSYTFQDERESGVNATKTQAR